MEAPQTLLILTQMPDEASARRLASSLVEARLAACVSILAPSQSIYRWRNAVETATEVPLLIKTTPARYSAVEAAILQAHPYEVPEIVAVPVCAGLPEYLGWVVAETESADSRC